MIDANRTEKEAFIMLEQLGKQAKEASFILGKAGIEDKNEVLREAAKCLVQNQEYILSENYKDVENAKSNDMSEALIDRLSLNPDRIEAMAEGLRQVAELHDPIGSVEHMQKTPNGLLIGKKTVPLGVVGIIYESRPNVTADAFALCFKTGNACLLRGGSDAINSNLAITNVIQSALESCNMPKYSIQLLTDTSRETATKMMQLNEYLDSIISVKTVDSFDEAVAHINHYNTGHSEAIVTDSYQNAQEFLNQIDAAAVYVNASTRFTDGFEFGFGAEIGISTQKIHARGPMGLDALTTSKFIIYGNGQIRK